MMPLISWKVNLQKCQNKVKIKMDGVMHPQMTIPINFKHRQVWCSQNATNQPKSTVERTYMRPPLSTSNDTNQDGEIQKRLLLRYIYCFNRIQSICISILLNKINVPYAHYGHWTLITDPYPNKVLPIFKGKSAYCLCASIAARFYDVSRNVSTMTSQCLGTRRHISRNLSSSS